MKLSMFYINILMYAYALLLFSEQYECVFSTILYALSEPGYYYYRNSKNAI